MYVRILISDYSGHPFQVQLSRALAARGHEVRHVFSASFQTPKGRLTRAEDDPSTFSIEPVQLAETFEKGTFIKRRSQEIAIGKLIAEKIRAFAPEIVLSSNAPLDTQRQIIAATRDGGAKFIFWVQDIYSHAIAKVVSRKIPVIGTMIGAYYRQMEAGMIRNSDHAVLISPDFEAPVRDLAGSKVPLSVIENWAPLDEIATYPRDNAWATANLPPADFRVIYSGTLGFKHNPDLLLALAAGIKGDVLVFSEGDAANYLKAEAQKRNLANLKVSGWLPFDDLPKALAAADALLVVLEPEAGIYSVPSKALTYMCVGRPILGTIAPENLATRLIERHKMGLTVPANDAEGFVDIVSRLENDAAQASEMARNARAYAETTFNINTICDKFEAVFRAL